MSVVLPEPFDPSRQVMLPLDDERDVLQHVGAVVRGEDVLDAQLFHPLLQPEIRLSDLGIT